jgi:2,5-diamino-6-(ribosylamino)-4(3H)-pyrimidinone 5'-phosphate reductase
MSKSKNKNCCIINIMATTVDGKIASHNMESSLERNQIGMLCRDDFERMRAAVAGCDAIFIGARSMESEIGAFRVSDLKEGNTEPEWIIFTQSGNISFNHNFWQQEKIPKSIFFVSSFQFSEKPILRVEEKSESFGKINYYLGNISGLLKYLKSKNKNRFALLGGGKLNAAFWEQGLVDELLLTISPVLLGNIHSLSLVSSSHLLSKKLECKKVTQSGNFVFIDYKVY